MLRRVGGRAGWLGGGGAAGLRHVALCGTVVTGLGPSAARRPAPAEAAGTALPMPRRLLSPSPRHADAGTVRGTARAPPAQLRRVHCPMVALAASGVSALMGS